MCLVRRLVVACMKHNVLVRSEHVQGKQNTLADMLSRLQVQEFRQNAPYQDKVATRMPSALPQHQLEVWSVFFIV